MTTTNDAARVLCPRTCLDCCCQEHHWGDYGGDDEDEPGEDSSMQCKHCPARVDYTEPCTLCGRELLDHDFDTLACDPDLDGDEHPKFTYGGQPKRVCKQVHPWDVDPGPGDRPAAGPGGFRLLD